MTRKWMTVLLSLMLSVMLPLCALADTQHTLTLVPGDELASIPAVADMMDILSLTLTTGEDAGALTVTLDDADIATIALRADTIGLYALSNLLSDDVLYVTWDDAFAFLSDVVEAASTEEMDEAAREAMKASLEQAKTSLLMSLSGEAVKTAGTQSKEEALEEFSKVFGDDPKMMEYMQNAMDKVVEEKGTFEDAERDTADQKETLVMTKDDLMPIFESNYMRNTLRSSISSADPSLSEEELEKQVDEMLNEAIDVFSKSDFQMTMAAYTTDAGETLVGMEMGMEMTIIAESDEPSTMTLNMNYDRLTADTGRSHKGDMSMAFDGKEMMQLALDLTQGNDGVTSGLAGMLVEDEALTMTYHAENIPTDVRERVVSLYVRDDATAIIAPAASERPVILFKLVSSPAADDELAVISKATAENSVNVMKLSSEEMGTLTAGISGRCMQALGLALNKLPASVIQLFTTSTQME